MCGREAVGAERGRDTEGAQSWESSSGWGAAAFQSHRRRRWAEGLGSCRAASRKADVGLPGGRTSSMGNLGRLSVEVVAQSCSKWTVMGWRMVQGWGVGGVMGLPVYKKPVEAHITDSSLETSEEHSLLPPRFQTSASRTRRK